MFSYHIYKFRLALRIRKLTDINFTSKFYITQYFYLINKNYKWNWYNINGIVLWQKTWIFNKKVEVDIDSKFQQQKKTCKNIVMHSHDMWDIFHSKIDLTWHIFSYFLHISTRIIQGMKFFKRQKIALWFEITIRRCNSTILGKSFMKDNIFKMILTKKNSILDTYELFELRIEFHIFGL